MEGGSKYWITNYWTTILYVGKYLIRWVKIQQ